MYYQGDERSQWAPSNKKILQNFAIVLQPFKQGRFKKSC